MRIQARVLNEAVFTEQVGKDLAEQLKYKLQKAAVNNPQSNYYEVSYVTDYEKVYRFKVDNKRKFNRTEFINCVYEGVHYECEPFYIVFY